MSKRPNERICVTVRNNCLCIGVGEKIWCRGKKPSPSSRRKRTQTEKWVSWERKWETGFLGFQTPPYKRSLACIMDSCIEFCMKALNSMDCIIRHHRSVVFLPSGSKDSLLARFDSLTILTTLIRSCMASRWQPRLPSCLGTKQIGDRNRDSSKYDGRQRLPWCQYDYILEEQRENLKKYDLHS
jgi:hypothetical protein